MYSQNSEEQIITNYFKSFSGTLLDIGANDGVTLSNTWPLFQALWHGTAVEASPTAYERLLQNHGRTIAHNRIHCIHAAVTDFNGEITLHESGEHLGKGDTSLLSTIKRGETTRWVNQSFTDVTVPAINFETLLGLSRYKKFDFITIDIEGAEKEVLPQMNLIELECKLLCVEYNGKDQHWYDNLIIPQGFKLIHKNGENLIYGI